MFHRRSLIWRLAATALGLVVASAARAGEGDATIELLPPLESVTPLDPGSTIPPEGSSPAPLDDGYLWEQTPVTPVDPGAANAELLSEPIESVDGAIVSLDGIGSAVAPVPRPTVLATPIGYDTATGASSWIIGHDDRFGMVSFESFPTLPQPGARLSSSPSPPPVRRVVARGLVTGVGIHLLDGPVQTDMPPRLYDFSIGYQLRHWVWQNLGFDVAVREGAYSDFETSARDGVRFPSHAVAFLRTTPASQWILGVDVLDRDDISLLPVFGALWQPYDNLRLDLAFPRPSAAVRLGEQDEWLYIRGQLGGGTWAIERAATQGPDNATYRDLRLLLGVERRDHDGTAWRCELGYVFARELTYRSGVGDFELEDAAMISFTNAY
jgi:hypothetical protein